MLTPLCFSTLEACGGDEASIRAFAERFAAHGLAIGNVNAGGSLTAAASADRNRVTTATAMNDASSRSHSVLTLDIVTRSGAKILRGKLHLVDLAGSERVKKSEVQGQAFDEAVAINNSLTTLGRCVQALAAGPKGGKPPFRDTKLTRLLSSAFGGRANTVLITCVAPTASDSFETVNSLQFGQQVTRPDDETLMTKP